MKNWNANHGSLKWWRHDTYIGRYNGYLINSQDRHLKDNYCPGARSIAYSHTNVCWEYCDNSTCKKTVDDSDEPCMLYSSSSDMTKSIKPDRDKN